MTMPRSFFSTIPQSIVNINSLVFVILSNMMLPSSLVISQWTKWRHQSLIYTSTQSSLHSLFPNKFLNHSTPIPVHSLLAKFFFASSNAVPANAIAVLLKAPAYIKTLSIVSFERAVWLFISADEYDEGRGKNQLLLKSKKQWSAQWQEEAKRMSRRIEQ